MTSSTPMDDATAQAKAQSDGVWVTLAEAKQLTGLQARWIAEWSRVKKLPTRWDEKGGGALLQRRTTHPCRVETATQGEDQSSCGK